MMKLLLLALPALARKELPPGVHQKVVDRVATAVRAALREPGTATSTSKGSRRRRLGGARDVVLKQKYHADDPTCAGEPYL